METKYYDSPYRFFVNKDGIFQMGNYICKIYGDKLIAVGEESYEELKNASLEQALLLGESISHIRKMHEKSSTDCGDDHTVSTDKNNERIRLIVKCDWSNPPIDYYNHVTGYFQARPYHKVWPIWYRCTRDISVSIDFSIAFTNTSGNSDIFNYTNSYSRIDNEIEMYALGSIYVDTDKEIYFDSFHCWAKQENTSKGHL